MNKEIEDTLLEVKLENANMFSIIKETLTRIGVSRTGSNVAPKDKKQLFQTCHILNLSGKYYITHFKELFFLEGKESSLEELDICRRNQIAKLLQDWKLLTIVKPERFPVKDYYMKLIKIVSTNDPEYKSWKFIPKYHIKSKKIV